MNYLIKLKNLVLDILFPPICLSCEQNLLEDEKADDLCDKCLSKITIHTTLFCSICKNRLPENKKICHKNNAYLLGAITDYNYEIKNIIHYLKYKKWRRLSSVIKKILNQYLDKLNLKNKTKNYIIIPIPLHKNRLKERGFNQSEIISKIISEKLNLNIKNNILTRLKETKPQAELKNWEERKENLKNSFSINNSEEIKNKNIILIDDVYTSGSTINEAVKSLRGAGAKKIITFVVAKVN